MLSKEENGNDLNQIKKMIESFILQTNKKYKNYWSNLTTNLSTGF